MGNGKFLITSNPESAAILEKMGFQIINKSNGHFLFLNNKKIEFQKIDGVFQTNILTY